MHRGPSRDKAAATRARRWRLLLSGCSSQTTTGEVAALSLQLARALTDRELSDQLLARAVESALKLLDDRAV